MDNRLEFLMRRMFSTYENFYYNNPPMYRQSITLQQTQAIALQRVLGKSLHVDIEIPYLCLPRAYKKAHL